MSEPLEPLTKPISAQTEEIRQALFQLRVLPLGLLQDGDVGVGIFPEAKKAFGQSR
jgi:hypothetical protein